MPSLDVEQMDRQAREHAAWLDVVKECRALGIEPNDPVTDPLVCAVKKWGEELHQLRLGDPQHDERALDEARAEYEGQYERGTYPEKSG